MTPTSVLLVPLPEAEPVIDRYRRRLDPTGRQGMPAHVTVLVPFVPPSLLDGAVVAELAALFAAVPPFEYVLRRTGWFESRVLFLAPEPAEPFRRLTFAVAERFPQYRPYEGAFADVVPHVTVGEGGRVRRRRWRMRWAAGQLAGMAPIRATATEVWLMELDPARARWERRERFRLLGAPDVTSGNGTGDATVASGMDRAARAAD
ncbi:MAG: 2'-5' RNA ligase family protein [Acidimicrobiales bacterium]